MINKTGSLYFEYHDELAKCTFHELYISISFTNVNIHGDTYKVHVQRNTQLSS